MSDAKTPKPAKAAKKGFNFVLVLVPIALIAAVVLAFALPPTHTLIVNGPLKPLLARFGLASGSKSLASKADKPPDPVAEVKRLNDELETDRKAQIDKDARIAQLQAQVAKQVPAKADPSPTPVPPKPSPTAVPEDVKRAATYWAAMDADKAADIAQRLPQPYVRAVLSQMPADAVAEIMNAMPAKVAAKLTAGSEPDRP